MPCAKCDDDGLIFSGNEAVQCECVAEKVRLRYLSEAQIPKLYADAQVKAIRDPEVQRIARSMVAECSNQRERGGLLITGTLGTGKTYLAVAVLRSMIYKSSSRGLFASVGDMFADIKASFGKPGASDAVARYIQVPILALDDLGAENATEWGFDTLGQVLAERYAHCRPTICTTNYKHVGIGKPDSLADRIGMRAWDRLKASTVHVDMVGPSLRIVSRSTDVVGAR